MLIILIVIIIAVCVLFWCLKNRYSLFSGGQPTIVVENDHGICYAICALNMVLDCKHFRNVLPKDNGLNEIINGNYSSLDNAPRGGNPAELVQRWVNEVPDISDKVRYVYDTESVNDIKDSLENKFFLTGIIYECNANDVSNPDENTYEDHAIYVSYDRDVDEWVLLTNDKEYILSNPILKDPIRALEWIHIGLKLICLVIEYSEFKPMVLRYEISEPPPEKKLTLKERFALSNKPIEFHGSLKALEYDPVENITDETIRTMLTLN